MKKAPFALYYLLLAVAFLIYSATGILTKLASAEPFLSARYLILFSGVLCAMGIYAILWQIVLKKIPLTNAYLFKSMTVLFTLFFAWMIFGESVTWKNILGAFFIIAGICVNAKNVTPQ